MQAPLIQQKRVKSVAAPSYYVLLPVEHVRLGSISQRMQHGEMPKNFTVSRVKRDQVAIVITTEKKIASSGQNSRATQTSRTIRSGIGMTPSQLASLMVERFQHVL